MAKMGSKFLNTVFDKTKAKEPCRSCPHYMVRCTSGCFAYNFIEEEELAAVAKESDPT